MECGNHAELHFRHLPAADNPPQVAHQRPQIIDRSKEASNLDDSTRSPEYQNAGQLELEEPIPSYYDDKRPPNINEDEDDDSSCRAQPHSLAHFGSKNSITTSFSSTAATRGKGTRGRSSDSSLYDSAESVFQWNRSHELERLPYLSNVPTEHHFSNLSHNFLKSSNSTSTSFRERDNSLTNKELTSRQAEVRCGQHQTKRLPPDNASSNGDNDYINIIGSPGINGSSTVEKNDSLKNQEDNQVRRETIERPEDHDRGSRARTLGILSNNTGYSGAKDPETRRHEAIRDERGRYSNTRKAVMIISIIVAILAIIAMIILLAQIESKRGGRAIFMGFSLIVEVAVAAGMIAWDSNKVEVLISMNLVFVFGIFVTGQLDTLIGSG
ncbi:uncharacterized protein PV09_03071 [Verruconis gallopava]|uniref:Uncharacterized protein n=1 Tax=Verruconis gallopava TaxID=253628 RepID=A0A0D1XT26_9PEZI|nr:uncharacterized protein PV09_03071 [Verruconis gallopava]KIW05871.1 hypothetical protein PV09_03071 [Verruconis gallopava]